MARQKFFNSDSYCAMPFVGVNVTSGGNQCGFKATKKQQIVGVGNLDIP